MLAKHRVSSYVIQVRINSSEYLLIHGYSGAVDKVTSDVISALNEIKKGIKTNISAEWLDLLKSRGYLTEKTELQEREYIKILAEELHKTKDSHKFLFMVAYDCNFRCPYCFENEVSDFGKSWSGRTLNKELVDKAYQIIDEVSKPKQGEQIVLYGGEPLLSKNYEIVKYIVEQGTARRFRFTAITNGYDLNHFSDLLHKDKLSFLQITIDGASESHNETRILEGGLPTFDRIIENIELAIQKGVRIVIRMNIDKKSINQLETLVKVFEARNWLTKPNFVVYATPIFSESIDCISVMGQKGSGSFCSPNSSPSQLVQIHNLNQKSSVSKDDSAFANGGDFTRKFNSLKNANSLLKNIEGTSVDLENRLVKLFREGGLSTFKTAYCGAHNGMLIFDPYGDLYTCWELVGHDHAKVGSYYPTLDYDLEKMSEWERRLFINIPECNKCKYAFFCAGGCAAHSFNSNGNFWHSYCNGFQRMFHSAVPTALEKFEKQEKQQVDLQAC